MSDKLLLLVFCVQQYMKGLAELWKIMPMEDKEVSACADVDKLSVFYTRFKMWRFI